jgi:hypothetical protein
VTVACPEDTTEDLVDVSDLESLWDEKPPTCEITWRGLTCGKEAAWKLRCTCPRCSHTGEVFACNDCHNMITAGMIVQCNACHYHPMHQEWKPL